MSMIPCKGCGRLTYTALCNHMEGKPGEEAKECWAAWDTQKKQYVKGCAYDTTSAFIRELADHFIKREP